MESSYAHANSRELFWPAFYTDKNDGNCSALAEGFHLICLINVLHMTSFTENILCEIICRDFSVVSGYENMQPVDTDV